MLWGIMAGRSYFLLKMKKLHMLMVFTKIVIDKQKGEEKKSMCNLDF